MVDLADWQLILYLIVALVLFSVTLVWVWRGTWDEPLNQIGIVLNFLFILLGTYLFWHEETMAKQRMADRQ